jgi:hypothetical protein
VPKTAIPNGQDGIDKFLTSLGLLLITRPPAAVQCWTIA